MTSDQSGKYAFATLVASQSYLTGAVALVRSLKMTHTSATILVLVKAGIEGTEELESVGGKIVEVAPLPLSEDFRQRHSSQAQHARDPFTKGTKPLFHEALDNFCKLRLWELDGYERIVFIDADALVIRNIDKLFGWPEFSAAPNLYHELADMHRLNSGVFVAKPDLRTFERMLIALDQPGVFWRRTDQTFLETFYPDWHNLPYIYNTLQYVYFNLPELWHRKNIKVLHYQYEKPWQADHPKRDLLKPLIDLWQHVADGGAMPDQLPALRECESP